MALGRLGGRKATADPPVSAPRPTHLADDAFEGMSTGDEDTDEVLRPPSLRNPAAALLTADKVRAVRFHVATPHGYYEPEVDEFITSTIQTLQGLEKQLVAKNQKIHELHTDVDETAGKVRLLQSTIEIFRANDGSPATGADGEFLTESQLEFASRGVEQARVAAEANARRAVEEAEEANRQLASLQGTLEELTARRAAAEDAAASYQHHAAGLSAYVEDLQKWAAGVSEQQTVTAQENEQQLAAATYETAQWRAAYEALAAQVSPVPEPAQGPVVTQDQYQAQTVPGPVDTDPAGTQTVVTQDQYQGATVPDGQIPDDGAVPAPQPRLRSQHE